MVSKNQIKLIQQLQQKKYRSLRNLFIVEGEKSVREFLESPFELQTLFYTEKSDFINLEKKTLLITDRELRKISQLKTPNKVLAVFKIPLKNKIKEKGLTLVLDNVQDPGNLGTIIRLCDWFNVSQLVCSLETVDCYNSKVVQASMGSLSRVSVVYTGIADFLSKTQRPCFAAVMNGENVYKTNFPQSAILILGNEANGISKNILKLIDKPVTIPRFNKTNKPESLNVATATAILLSEFNRSITQK